MSTLLLALPLLVPAPQDLPAGTEPVVLSERVWHLGDDETPEWPEGPAAPEGHLVELDFEAAALPGEGLLVVQQRHVDNPWLLSVNGVALGELERGPDLRDVVYALPPGTLVDGANRLRLEGLRPTDDITFGKPRLVRAGWRELFDLRPVRVRVTAGEREGGGAPLPARVTVARGAGGGLARLFYAERELTAVREGVVYTADGLAEFELPPGRYEVFAARGMEWSMARASFEVLPSTVIRQGSGTIEDAAPDVELALALTREVDTAGFVATDTHLHTLTFSGHGDASVEERLVTFAGEGVELAIATDHNHNTDYRPLQRSMGLNDWFTPAVGNEVSTPIGHLNAFPLDPADPVPAHDLSDIVEIVEGVRAAGAEVVILNHPRWPSHEEGPHGVHQLDHASGAWTGDWACPFDAMELINSQTAELEPMLLFRDWFALMNRGERVMAVGSSDSHTVGGVAGQGRTYLAIDDTDPAAVDVSAAARALREGRSSISMGIFVDARLPREEGGRSVLGEVLRPRRTELRVAAPSWVTPRRLRLFANGRELAVYPLDGGAVEPRWPTASGRDREGWDVGSVEVLSGGPGVPFEAIVRPGFELAWPTHDFWMVAVVEGDGVGSAAWPQINDYTLAATNPVYFDVDGDGAWRDPRRLAEALVAEHGTDLAAVAEALTGVDDAVAVQLLGLVRAAEHARVERGLLELVAGRDALRAWIDATRE